MVSRQIVVSWIACTALAALPVSAAKADPKGQGDVATLAQQAAKNPSIFSFGYGTNSSPALNLLGLSPSKVQMSNGLTPLALSIPSLFDGGAGESIGIDLLPAWALQNVWPLDLNTYERDDRPLRDILWRDLVRTHIEFAGTNGMASTDPTKLQQSGFALSLGTSLLDQSDPIAKAGGGRYFLSCADKVDPAIYAAMRAEALAWSQQSAPNDLAIEVKTLVDLKLLNSAAFDGGLKDGAPKIVADLHRLDPSNLGKLPEGLPPDESAVQPSPPSEAVALAELQDIFAQYATQPGAAAVAAARAKVFADELNVIAGAHELKLVRPTGMTVSQERSDALRFYAATSDPWLRSALMDLVAAPEFGGMDHAAADGDGVDHSADVAYVRDHLDALHTFADSLAAKADSTFAGQTRKAIFDQSGVTTAITTCAQAASQLVNGNPDLNAGFGYVEAGKPGAVGHLHDGGETVWFAGRVPVYSDLADRSAAELAKGVGNYVMLGGSLNYTNRASLTTGDATSPIMVANVFGAWVGLQGNTDWVRGGLQAGYTQTKAVAPSPNKFSTSGWRYLSSLSFKVNDTLWVGGSYGTANGTTSKLDDKTFLLTLTFTAPKPTAIFNEANSAPTAPSP